MSKNKNNQTKYIIYARLASTSLKADDPAFASDQVSILKELAKNEGLEVIDVYKEHASANFAKPLFDEMITRIKKGEANSTLCIDMNRLYRNDLGRSVIRGYLESGVIKSIRTLSGEYIPNLIS